MTLILYYLQNNTLKFYKISLIKIKLKMQQQVQELAALQRLHDTPHPQFRC